MEILLAGLMALVPAAAAPQATATDVGAGATARASHHTFQAQRTCKTIRTASGRTITVCTPHAFRRNCFVLTGAEGHRTVLCVSSSRS